MKKAFVDLLRESVSNTNDMYAEEGRYLAYNMVEFDGITLIQRIDMDVSLNMETYKVDLDALESPYTEAYNADGGDAEYGSMETWMVDWRLIKENGRLVGKF